ARGRGAGRSAGAAAALPLWEQPARAYTGGLRGSIPRLDAKGEELRALKGLPPNLLAVPPGCPFHPRCSRAVERCAQEVPAYQELGSGRASACHFAEEMMTRR